MYKLVAIDMDGTLLNPQGEITPQNRAAIQKAQENGVHIVLASGRPILGMQPALESLELNTDKHYVISYNGAMVQKVASKEVLHQSVLTHQQVLFLANHAKQLNLDFQAFSTELGLITPKMNPWTQHECDINKISAKIMSLDELEPSHHYLKAMLLGEESALDNAMKLLEEEVSKSLSMVRSATFFLEFMPHNVTKWTGIQALLDHLSLDSSQVIALGDQGNDHQMIQNAGLGIAMENATDATKAVANAITASNKESGVGRAIEKYILNA